MQAIGGGYASYADGTIFQMIPECLGEYDVTPEAVLKVMDEAGVSKAVMLQGNFLGPQNLYTYEAAKKYPDRLAAAATYDPFCRNVDSIRKHLFEDLGIKIVKFEVSTGSGLMSYHPTIPLDGDVIEEMLSYAEMHNNTVVFDIGRYPAECWQPEALARAIKRHPDTQFVVCHLLAPRLYSTLQAFLLIRVKTPDTLILTQSIILNAPSNLSEATDLCGEATCL
jgi:predicted TIM-barrel fold metal-dependent hydrolase